MRYRDRISEFVPPEFEAEQGKPIPNPPTWDQLLPPPPGFVAKLFGGTKKYADAALKAKVHASKLWNDHENEEKARLESLAQDRAEFQAEIEKQESAHHLNCTVWLNAERQMCRRDQATIEWHFSMAMASMEGAFGTTRVNSITYRPAVRRLVVEIELPHWEVLHGPKEHKYIQVRDEFTTVMRSEREIVPMYKSIIQGTALAALHTAFAEDMYGHVDSCIVNVSMRTSETAEGGELFVTHASLGTTKEAYLKLDHHSAGLVRLHLAGAVTSRPRMLKSIKRLADDVELV